MSSSCGTNSFVCTHLLQCRAARYNKSPQWCLSPYLLLRAATTFHAGQRSNRSWSCECNCQPRPQTFNKSQIWGLDFNVSVVSACLEAYDKDEPRLTSEFENITQNVDEIWSSTEVGVRLHNANLICSSFWHQRDQTIGVSRPLLLQLLLRFSILPDSSISICMCHFYRSFDNAYTIESYDKVQLIDSLHLYYLACFAGTARQYNMHVIMCHMIEMFAAPV